MGQSGSVLDVEAVGAGSLGSLGTSTPAERLDPGRWWVLATCCIVVFSRLIAPPIWAITPSTLQEAFGAQNDLFRYVNSVGAVPQIIFLMIGGVVGDLYGRRRVLLIGMYVYLVLSVLCLFATGQTSLIVLRTLSTWGGALAAPVALAIVRLSFDERELPLAILCYTGTLSVAGGLAPLLGVVLDEPFGWRAMFVVPVAATVLGVCMAQRHLVESKVDARRSSLDMIACATWATVSLVLFYAIVGAQSPTGWARQVTLIALAVGVVGSGVLLWYEFYARRTVVRRAPFRKRALSVLLVAGALMNMVLVGYFLQLWGFFDKARAYGAVLAVFALAPALPAILLVVGLLAWLQRRYDARVMISGGLLVMALAVALTALGANWAPYLWFVVPMMLLMMSYMIIATAWTTAFFLAVQRHFAGVNAAINNSAGLIGSVLGGTLLGALLVAFGQADFLSRLDAAGVPRSIAERGLDALNFGLQLDPASVPEWSRALLDTVLAAYRRSYATAFGQVLGLLAGLCFACAVFVWFGLMRSDATAEVAE